MTRRRTDGLLGCLVLLVLAGGAGPRAYAQTPEWTGHTPDESVVPMTADEPRISSTPTKTQTHVAVLFLGARPLDERLAVGPASVSDAELKRSFGGGVKVGAFPGFAGGVIGLEGELFGFGGGLNARNTGVSGADGTLVAMNGMVNLLIRYPGTVIQPYIGAGVSLGVIDANNIQSGTFGVSGTSARSTLAFQLIGGLRTYLSDTVYLFGEYKYFGAKYEWESGGGGNPELSLSFRAHIVAVGFGFSF